MKLYIVFVLVAAAIIGAIVITQWNSSPQSEPVVSQAPGPGAKSSGISGRVLETMDAGGYTYVHVDTGSDKIWAAGPETKVEVGQNIQFELGMEMRDFRSETLGRTFDSIHFVASFDPRVAGSAVPEGHPPISPPSPNATGQDLSGIEVADSGLRVADVHAKKGELAGKDIAVRGRVVKFTSGVMGKNWIHVMDGSGADGTNDLTVTTDAEARVGDTVLISGQLSLDKDFGFGYEYDVIVEDAQVTVETVH